MATYVELNQILTDTVDGAQALRERIRVAGYIAAETIISNEDDTDPPWDQTAGMHDQRLKWVDRLLSSGSSVNASVVRELFFVVVAANESASQAAILGATDAAIQSNVNESIDSLSANLA